jgi:hypothetical protein
VHGVGLNISLDAKKKQRVPGFQALLSLKHERGKNNQEKAA